MLEKCLNYNAFGNIVMNRSTEGQCCIYSHFCHWKLVHQIVVHIEGDGIVNLTDEVGQYWPERTISHYVCIWHLTWSFIMNLLWIESSYLFSLKTVKTEDIFLKVCQ